MANRRRNREVFEIERILAHRMRSNNMEFFVKWVGYDMEHNSWEPHQNINSPRLVEQYWMDRQRQNDEFVARRADEDSDDHSDDDMDYESDDDEDGNNIANAA